MPRSLMDFQDKEITLAVVAHKIRLVMDLNKRSPKKIPPYVFYGLVLIKENPGFFSMEHGKGIQ
jgi:hypothetical protein